MAEEKQVQETEAEETPEETQEETEAEEQVQEEPAEEPQDRKSKRFTDLSEKVKQTSEELAKERKAREFAEAFVDVAAKYKGSTEYKEQIREKVMNGYTVEDAALTVLAAEGKLGGAPKPITGGSAATNPPESPVKPLDQMTTDEKRAALIEAEERGELRL